TMSGTGVFDLDSLRDRRKRERKKLADSTPDGHTGGEEHEENVDTDTTVHLRREPLTVILQVSNIRDDAEVHRQIGINDALTFIKHHYVLVNCFDLPYLECPLYFYYLDEEAQRINPIHQVAEFLWRNCEVVEFPLGLWDFKLSVAEI